MQEKRGQKRKGRRFEGAQVDPKLRCSRVGQGWDEKKLDKLLYFRKYRNMKKPVRLLLSAHPTGMVAGELQEELGIPASTLSHHLEKLRQVGLVSVRRASTFLWYTANADSLREVLGFLYEECCTRSRAVPAEEIVQISR